MRKLLLVALLATAVVVLPATTARADDHDTTDWVCVVVVTTDIGVCRQNPLPDSLPLHEDCYTDNPASWKPICDAQKPAWDAYWLDSDELPMDTAWGVCDTVMDTLP